jgi:glycosyltransferase involved in cell wall biosynthesis
MIEEKKIAVVVPAYNEARKIASMLRTIPGYVDDIVVVDDGSADQTVQCAKSVKDQRVTVFRHPINRGVGAAIATGYTVAFRNGADMVAVMAGDGQMDPDDLLSLLEPVLRGEAEYTKGDRLSHPQAMRCMPFLRWLGNHVFSAVTRLITGIPVRDSQCGYTVLSREVAPAIPFDSLWRGYGYPNDILGRLAQLGIRVNDVVVKPVYRDETSGVGFRHAFFVVPYVLFRVLCRRIFPFRKSLQPSARTMSGVFRVDLPPRNG